MKAGEEGSRRSAGSRPSLPHPLPDELVELLSDRMALLGDATRIRILDELRGGERNVQTIANALKTTQQNVSGHLRLLRVAGVVARRPAGREAIYSAVDDSVVEVWERLLVGMQQRQRGG
jgi:DNA-binding transcriptional ArsR family regulator